MTGKDGRTGIDWNMVRQRLTVAAEALENDFAPSPQKRREILQARAQALAVEPQAPTLPCSQIEVIEFILAEEHYAVETVWVREVYPLKDLTPLPCVPAFVLGIVNMHGSIMAVIDIKKFFDLPERGLPDLNKIIILQYGAIEFGILADQIVGARTVSLAALQPALPTLTGIRADYLKGITPERLVVLDAKKLLDDRSIIVNEEVPV